MRYLEVRYLVYYQFTTYGPFLFIPARYTSNQKNPIPYLSVLLCA
jgi:hypothetical protein